MVYFFHIFRIFKSLSTVLDIFLASNPCQGFNFYIGNSSVSTSVPEFAIAKWPNLRPTLDNIAWTSYDWEYQNITIDIWDPDFEGGYSCGPNLNEECQYVVGVFGYCAVSQEPLNYTMRITPLSPVTFTSEIDTQQQVSAGGMRQYGFCVDTERDVTAELLSWTNACDCPTTYANLDMVISKTDRNANAKDLVWRVDKENSSISLLTSDVDTRPGSCKILYLSKTK
jgi:hypothetical protein